MDHAHRGLARANVDVRWEVAEDEGITVVRQNGSAPALVEHDGTVHVDADGLEPGIGTGTPSPSMTGAARLAAPARRQRRAASRNGCALVISTAASAFGDLVALHVLDTRQYRSPRPCRPLLMGAGRRCPAAEAPETTMLGAEQERWLADGLAGSTARWDLLAQQTVVSPIGVAGFYNLDQWDGRVAARRRLLDALAAPASNPVILTGDFHVAMAADLRRDPDDRSSPVVAAEIVTPSISSAFGSRLAPMLAIAARANEHLHWYHWRHRGYVRLEVTPQHVVADYRLLDSPRDPAAGVRTAHRLEVVAGRRGICDSASPHR